MEKGLAFSDSSAQSTFLPALFLLPATTMVRKITTWIENLSGS
jgi:hypothetical protein